MLSQSISRGLWRSGGWWCCGQSCCSCWWRLSQQWVDIGSFHRLTKKLPHSRMNRRRFWGIYTQTLHIHSQLTLDVRWNHHSFSVQLSCLHQLEDGTSMSQHRCGCPRHLDDLLWPWPFTFDLQNLIRSSVGTDEYSLSLLQKLFKVFLRYCGNNICPDEWTNKQTNRRTNATTRQSKNLMPSLTVSVGVRSFVHYCGQRSSLLWTLALIPYALAHGENGNG